MEWNRKSVKRKVKEVIIEAGKQKKEPQDSDDLINNLQFDSLKLTGLFAALETAFDQPLSLREWVSEYYGLASLSVASLSDHIFHVLERQK